ncbi:MAG: tRNA pseudouridine(55) synthase TruB [Treponema sp.]|nr:tRNA pseudouridine(55) synthase TruB [Treponema sp.]
MPKKKKNPENPSGIILYAKRSGITSFSSLWSVKKAIDCDKVGHTGTLDSFAEGLLVVLSGSLTHLVSHVTSFRKKYLAVICFGSGTDTLDPVGRLTGEGKALSREDVAAACSHFTGALLQVPPVFSALHVGGQRASDLARKGGEVDLESRQIFIYKNELLDYKAADESCKNSYALVEVECSKGTYIRALARDMAALFGSVAHLSALRRTEVGPFALEEAACFSLLDDFTIENAIEKEKLMRQDGISPQKDGEDVFADIRNHFLSFTPGLAFSCGLRAEGLKAEWEKAYLNGRPLSAKMFVPLPMDADSEADFKACESQDERAVFYENGLFAGMTRIGASRPEYSFVVPKKSEKLRVYSWADMQEGEIPKVWKEKGVALSAGSFDALHRGHLALIDAVLAQKKLVPGIVLFRSPFRGEDGSLLPSALSLRQRLEFLEKRGVRFAVVLDFSPALARTDGEVFLKTLVRACNLRYLAEGQDFRCGWKGSFARDSIADLAEKEGFSFDLIADVEVAGERASSSRVRTAVASAGFALASELLGRPFEFDCRSLRFVKGAARLTGRQVCPPDGEYAVETALSDGRTASCQCRIQDGSLIIMLPQEYSGSEPVSVRF